MPAKPHADHICYSDAAYDTHHGAADMLTSKYASQSQGRPKALTLRQDQFCREFLLDLNATRAAIRAGFSAKTAKSIGSRLMSLHEVRARIEELRTERNNRLEMKSDDIVKWLIGVVLADPRKLTSYHVGACRHCWGNGHAYQWRHERELAEAIRKAKENNEPPNDEGGFGYSRARRPNPYCPDCDGYGIGFTVFTDTRDLDEEGMMLFRGVRETRDGVTIIMADKNRALERLADHFGIYDKHAHGNTNSFTDMVQQLLRAGGAHTRAPIRKDNAPSGGS